MVRKTLRVLFLGWVTVFLGSPSGAADVTLGSKIKIMPGLGPGSLDPTLDEDGRLELNLPFFGGMGLQADGKAVLCGLAGNPAFNSDLLVTRIEHHGAIDTAYGDSGLSQIDITVLGGSSVDICSGVAVQPDGKAVVSGYRPGNGMFAVRLQSDGLPDPSFGIGGVSSVDLFDSESHQVVLQADGKILLVGSVVSDPGNSDFAIVRLHENGFRDLEFGIMGVSVVDLNTIEFATDAAILDDGRILVAGATGTSAPVLDFAVLRLKADGDLDLSFGAFGKVTTDFGGLDVASGIAVLSDGGAVVVGSTAFGGGDFALARYEPNGSLVSGFGTLGKVTTDFGGEDGAADVELQADGRLLVVGGSRLPAFDDRFAVARYATDGSLDGFFGTGGRVTTAFPNGGLGQVGILQPDGRLLVAGTGQGTAVARYFTQSPLVLDFPTLSPLGLVLMVLTLAVAAVAILRLRVG